VASVEKLRRLIEPAGGLLVPGHDPDNWPTLIADGGEYD
jgi:hypothetical protein